MQTTSKLLNTTDHSRDSAGLTYVYPVISRRAGGVSIGINLNPNNACNWRCVYCQVPDLKRGTAPSIDLEKFEAELRLFLSDLIHGDLWIAMYPEVRKISDIALSETASDQPENLTESSNSSAISKRLCVTG